MVIFTVGSIQGCGGGEEGVGWGLIKKSLSGSVGNRF